MSNWQEDGPGRPAVPEGGPQAGPPLPGGPYPPGPNVLPPGPYPSGSPHGYPAPPPRPELPPLPPPPAYPRPPSDASNPTPARPPRRTHRANARSWRSRTSRALGHVVGVQTSRTVREYLDLQRQLTAAVTSGRRVAVLSIEPAQGSTTVAALLGTALATRRVDPVLLVDAAAGTFYPPLHHIFGATPVRTIGDLADRPPRLAARADFTGQLTPVGTDMWLIPADPVVRTSGHHAPDAGTYTRAVTPFIRYFDITVTDLSSAPGMGTAELLLERAHALCLVTSATRTGFEGVTSRLRELRDHMGSAWAGRTVVVANTTSESGAGRWWPRPESDALRHRVQDIPVVTLRFDPELRPGFPSRLGNLRPSTHLAAMRLAADVLGTAVPVAV
jgi:MinD-like ATPase involved in chromosome partitioning or flagellar assembly